MYQNACILHICSASGRQKHSVEEQRAGGWLQNVQQTEQVPPHELRAGAVIADWTQSLAEETREDPDCVSLTGLVDRRSTVQYPQ